MILIIDNLDASAYNLLQGLHEVGAPARVVRSDRTSCAALLAQPPTGLLLAHGPGQPRPGDLCHQLLEALAGQVPILGVGFGHLAIGRHFGATVMAAPRPLHGKLAEVQGDGLWLYHGLRTPFKAMCYHSLLVAMEGLPAPLQVSATTADGTLMGLRHRELPVEGCLFHPESIMTAVGKRLLRNFANQTKG